MGMLIASSFLVTVEGRDLDTVMAAFGEEAVGIDAISGSELLRGAHRAATAAHLTLL